MRFRRCYKKKIQNIRSKHQRIPKRLDLLINSCKKNLTEYILPIPDIIAKELEMKVNILFDHHVSKVVTCHCGI